MRDFIAVTALLVSLSGIAVSLAREEVRCYIGLNAEPCQVKQPESPGFNRQEAFSVGKDSDRKSSDINPNSTEPSTSSVDKSLNKNNPDNLPPTSQDSTAIPETPTTLLAAFAGAQLNHPKSLFSFERHFFRSMGGPRTPFQ